MNSHITQKKPSIIQRALHQLGLVEMHTKVNCWFCNQDSYILAGTRNTKDHWFCTLCENTNVTDERGEILDPNPFLMDQVTREAPARQPTFVNSPTRHQSFMDNGGQELCEVCQERYSIIYHVLSEYLPDEDDPTFEEKYRNADQETKRLHRSYQLCDRCDDLVSRVLQDKARTFKFENLKNLVIQGMSDNKINKRPTRTQYYAKGFIWFCTQISTLLFVYYSTVHPPQHDIEEWSISNMISLDFLTDMLISWRYYVDPTTITKYLLSRMQAYRNVAVCFFTLEDSGCTWSIKDNIATIVLINIISSKAIDWQYRVTPRVYEGAKNFHTYKKTQWFLYLLRFVTIGLFAIGASYKVVWSVMILYIAILVISNNMIFISSLFHYNTNNRKEVKNSYVAVEEEEPLESMEDIEMSIVAEEPTNTDHEISNIINRMQHL